MPDTPAPLASAPALLASLMRQQLACEAAFVALSLPAIGWQCFGLPADQALALIDPHRGNGLLVLADLPGSAPHYAGHAWHDAGGALLGVAGLLLTQPPDAGLLASLARFAALAQAQAQALSALRQTEEALQALRADQERMALAVAGSGTGLWDRNIQTGDIHYSAGWKSLLGYAEHEIGSRIEESYARLHPDDTHYVKAAMQAHFDGATDAYQVEHRLLCRDGSYRWVASRGRIVTHDDQGRPLRMMGTTIDITERKLAEARLHELASTDGLTRLPNRRQLLQHLQTRWQALQQAPAEPAAVLMFDLDHFKDVNDRHGHAAGDDALAHFADILRKALQPDDAAGRMGGEEFAVILGRADAARADAFACRILRDTRATPLPTGARALTTSVGLSMMRADDPSPQAVLARGDQALYRAKALGRNRREWG
ncbi:diguanylate cyclase [Bordetella genomosp. 12]|uniref:Diguanylate cyclase n=2 Tax=Bordetella genomosp. 12 TaxID=463035 RepID=A0A261VVA1_9BORD|nr:diguanylate cyclase [Bordetella genomosp. 12]